MSDSGVGDDETLYRRIQTGRGYYFPNDEGGMSISAEAFSDPERQPSVDRAGINQYDPSKTQIDNSDAVLKTAAVDVRRINLMGGTPPEKLNVDVVPDPLVAVHGQGSNPAHAKIRTNPPCPNKAFRRLKQSLAQIVQAQGVRMWAIRPVEIRRTPE